MSSHYKAVILAAGQGSRLGALTETRPKCLVDLCGRSVLEWQLRHLHAAGVREAVVVTGFGANLVDREVARLELPGMRVRTQFNPFYHLADNLVTCWLARSELVGPCLILNGDSLIETGIPRALLSAPDADITVTIDRKASYDEDDMKVLTSEDDKLLGIGKTITEYDGESIGFLRFSPEGATLFTRYVEQAIRQPEGLTRWYLSVIDQIARETGRVRVCSIEGLDWAEMDFPADVPKNLALAERWTANPST